MEEVNNYDKFEYTTQPLSKALAILERLIENIALWDNNAPTTLKYD